MSALAIALALIVTAYLLGSLSGSLLLGRLRGVDTRARGSGNAGGTNALRTQGCESALGVVPLDIGKGALADEARRLFACAAASLVLFTHRRNPQRLRAGSGSRFERVRLLRKRA